MNFDKQINGIKNDMVRATQELIKIRSTQEPAADGMPFGKGMDAALDYVLGLAEDMGFTTRKIDGYCGYAEYGEGDIYIGIFGHVDVNDEDIDEWKYNPYGGVIEKNRIYGCCAIDKGALIASLFALKAVKDTGKKLKRKVRLIIGTDERRYFTDMACYLKNENPPIAGITLDGHFPVTYAEKALAMMEYRKEISQETDEKIVSIKGGKLDNIVPGYCKAQLKTSRRSEIASMVDEYAELNRKDINAKILEDGVLIEAFGKERHCASIEKGINSIAIMLDFLKSINFSSGVIGEAVKFLCDKIGYDIYGESLGVAYEDGFSGKTTVNFGIMNFDNDVFQIRLDCRFPTTCNYVQAIETIENHFKEAGFEKIECTSWAPTYFPENHFLITALLEAYREITKENSDPVSSSSVGYSKVMPNIAGFGAHYPGEGIIWDQTDEYLEIDSLEKTAKIYANAIYKLCTEI